MNNTIPRILTYCPLSYNGTGPGRSCVVTLENFPAEIVKPELVIARAIKRISSVVTVRQSLTFPFRFYPWKIISSQGKTSLNAYYRNLVDNCDPENTIAYFWPDPPIELVEHTVERGILSVREMTNCFRGSAKRILDDAYHQLGLEPTHGITEYSVEIEKEELSKYDFILASSQVEPTLTEAGIDQNKILPTAFGWSPSGYKARNRRNSADTTKALFVGTVGVRKGVPQLLESWVRSGINGNS